MKFIFDIHFGKKTNSAVKFYDDNIRVNFTVKNSAINYCVIFFFIICYLFQRNCRKCKRNWNDFSG